MGRVVSTQSTFFFFFFFFCDEMAAVEGRFVAQLAARISQVSLHTSFEYCPPGSRPGDCQGTGVPCWGGKLPVTLHKACLPEPLSATRSVLQDFDPARSLTDTHGEAGHTSRKKHE